MRHLRYCFFTADEANERRHPQEVMRSLGIDTDGRVLWMRCRGTRKEAARYARHSESGRAGIARVEVVAIVRKSRRKKQHQG